MAPFLAFLLIQLEEVAVWTLGFLVSRRWWNFVFEIRAPTRPRLLAFNLRKKPEACKQELPASLPVNKAFCSVA